MNEQNVDKPQEKAQPHGSALNDLLGDIGERFYFKEGKMFYIGIPFIAEYHRCGGVCVLEVCGITTFRKAGKIYAVFNFVIDCT